VRPAPTSTIARFAVSHQRVRQAGAHRVLEGIDRRIVDRDDGDVAVSVQADDVTH